MTKTHVLTGGRRGDHRANLDVRVGDDHAVNQEFNQLPLLFPGCLLKAALHPGTEGFHGLREPGQILLPLCFCGELVFLPGAPAPAGAAPGPGAVVDTPPAA
jgi:hypothetical protein